MAKTCETNLHECKGLKSESKTAPTHSLAYLEPRLSPGQGLVVCCLIPALGTMPSPLPALHKHLINCPFIYFPCRALRPARGPASQRPSLHGTRAALCAQGYGPPSRAYVAAAASREEGASAGPTSCRVRAGRAPASLAACCVRAGPAGPQHQQCGGARGRGGRRRGVRGEGNPGLARRLRPRGVRGGARVKRAGAGPPGAGRAECFVQS